MNGKAIHADTRIMRSRNILESDVDGDVIALDVERGNCYGLNSTASHAWAMLERETSLAEICEALTQRFDVDALTCQAEIGSLIEELRAEGLVDVVRA